MAAGRCPIASEGGASLNEFFRYWVESWPALVPALFTLLVNPWSIAAFRRTASARDERRERALEELIDRLEAIIVWHHGLSSDDLHNLLCAVASRHRLKTKELHKPIEILQRVYERIMTNPHLDTLRREEYAGRILPLMGEVRYHAGVLALDALIAAVKQGYWSTAKGRAEELQHEWAISQEDYHQLAELRREVGSVNERNKAVVEKLVAEMRQRWVDLHNRDPLLLGREGAGANGG